MFEVGSVVHHKVTGQQMVILFSEKKHCKCRYQNPITGLYEMQEFLKGEFKEAPFPLTIREQG